MMLGELTSSTRLGFRVSKKVNVRISITAPPTILRSAIFLEKRAKHVRTLPTGALVGSFIDAGKTGACVVAPQPTASGASQVCHTEKFNLSGALCAQHLPRLGRHSLYRPGAVLADHDDDTLRPCVSPTSTN